MFQSKTVQCLIFYSQKYKSQKLKLKKILQKLKFNVECYKIKPKSKDENQVKIKNIKKKISNNSRCLILFYLNDLLRINDTKVVEMYFQFYCKRLRGYPKLFMFYGEDSNNDRDGPSFFSPEEPEILYIYCKKIVESEFSYIDTFIDSISNDSQMSIYDIHQNIIQENTHRRNSFSAVYFCSMRKSFVIDKRRIKEYLSRENLEMMTNNEIIISQSDITEFDDEAQPFSIENQFEEPQNFNPDKLVEEFGSIGDSLNQLKHWKEDKNKVKRFIYYFMITTMKSTTSTQGHQNLVETFMLTLKDTYQNDERLSEHSIFIIEFVTNNIFKNISSEKLLFMFDMVSWVVCNYSKFSLSNLKQTMEKLLKNLNDYIETDFKSDFGNAEFRTSFLIVILNILYTFYKLNGFTLNLTIAFKLAKYIFENYKIGHPIFTYLRIGPAVNAIFSIISGVANIFSKVMGTEDQNAISIYNKMNKLKIDRDLCLIISDNNSANKQDLDLIKNAFKQKFHIQEMETKSRETFFAELLGIKNAIQNSVSKVVIFILTRENPEIVKMENEDFVLKIEILNHFSNKNCEILRCKPKLCFLQTVLQKTCKQECCYDEYFEKSDFFIGHGNLKEDNSGKTSYIQTLIDLLKSKKCENFLKIGMELNGKFNTILKKMPTKTEYVENASFEYCLWENETFMIDI